MEYLKKWKVFFEELENDDDDISSTPDSDGVIKSGDSVNKEALESISKDLTEFKSKRGIVSQIFSKGLKMSDSELEGEIESKIFQNSKERNKYLSGIISIYKAERRINKITLSIEEDLDRKTDTQRQIDELIQRFNQLSDDSIKSKVDQQRKKSEEYLKKLNKKIEENKKQLSQSNQNLSQMKTDFDKMMSIEEEKIKSLQK
jgi:chromosome segregation ATPase